ncbi:MAG TPA: PAS domain S-box protein [Acidimicrobiales bacterium]|nr:PAS domain S-box protein [Acidimicrobiales bacterium]
MATDVEAAEADDNHVELEEGGRMLETFLSLMPDAAVAVDRRGTIVAVNERTEAFFGYSANELEGKPLEVLVPERFRHPHRRHRAEFMSEPHARPMGAGLDLYARRRDGSEFPVDISLAPISGGQGSLVVAAVRDITERKASQSAQAQLAAIVRSSTDGIFSMTESAVITSWNQAAEAMFGYERADMVGHHLSQFFPDDPALEELLDAARSGRPSEPRDTRWLTRDGVPIDVAISVSHLDLSGDAGYSVLVRDIRVRKAAEAQLRRQARWQTAAAEIRLSLLSDASLDASLTLMCKWAVDLSRAGAAVLVIEDNGRRRLAASYGESSALAQAAKSLAKVTDLADNSTTGLGGGLVGTMVPISFPKSGGATTGALVIVFFGEPAPEQAADEMLASLASQAILAFELDSVRSERDRLLISADRERIARDLHDLVIQRLFGAGLRLQGVLNLIDNEAASARVSSTIDDLDTTIKEIREAIFALESAPGTGLRAKVLNEVADATEVLGFKPVVSFHGLVDQDIELHIQQEAAAVLREALSNAARHAHAGRVEVNITVDDEVGVLVADNGIGMGETERLSGIANARARAELLGGHLDVSAASGGGTCFDWRAPIRAPKTTPAEPAPPEPYPC